MVVFSCRFTSDVFSATIQTPAALKREKAMLYKAVYLVRLVDYCVKAMCPLQQSFAPLGKVTRQTAFVPSASCLKALGFVVLQCVFLKSDCSRLQNNANCPV